MNKEELIAWLKKFGFVPAFIGNAVIYAKGIVIVSLEESNVTIMANVGEHTSYGVTVDYPVTLSFDNEDFMTVRNAEDDIGIAVPMIGDEEC